MVAGLHTSRVKTNISKERDTYTISVNGNFDFNLVKPFRESYTKLESIPETIIVDMRHVDTIDSAALGMLINMKKQLGKADGEIDLRNCNATVKKILLIACFNMMFNID